MKRSLLTLLTLSLTLASMPGLQAQNFIFFEKTDSRSYLVRHNDGGASEAITDFFIENISQGSGKPLSQTEYILVHDVYLRGTKRNTRDFQVYGTLQNLRFNGDTRYRTFDMADQLQPSAVRFVLERVNEQGNVLDSWDFNSVPLTDGATTLANFEASDSMVVFDGHTLRFRDLVFLYGKEDKLPFIQRKNVIDEYYAAVPELEALYQELRNIDPKDIDGLNGHAVDLRKLRSQIENLRSGNYEQVLALNAQNDPAGFLSRFSEVDQYAAELAEQIKFNQANLHLLYYQRGLDHLEQDRRDQALPDLNEAIRIAPGFAPAHLALARLRYQEGNLPAATSGLLNIFSQLNPNEDTRNQARTLASTIFQNNLGNAQYAIRQARYEDGLAELDAAASLCEGIAGLDCTPELTGLQRQAHSAIFNRFLDNAEISLEAKQPNQAIQDAEQAAAYAQQFGNFLNGTARLDLVLNAAYLQQYNRMVDDADLLLQNDDLDGAGQQLEDAFGFREQHPEAISDESRAFELRRILMDRRYHNLISEGRQLGAQNKQRDALDRYESALALQNVFAVEKDSLLPGLMQETARTISRSLIAQALEMARSNRLREARSKRLEIEELRKKYDILGDAAIKSDYEQLKDAIFTQECTNAQQELDALVARAGSEAASRDYLAADASYREALAVSANNGACGLKVAEAKAGLARIADAAKYQQQRVQIDEQIDRALYKKAVAAYQAAGQQFLADSVGEKFNLVHPDLFDFIQRTGRREFMRYGVAHFTDVAAYDKAIALLRDLLRVGYKKGRLKLSMIRIGEALAVRDFQRDPTTDPKEMGMNYTGGDRDLKKIYKAYKKKWRRLD